MLPKPIRDFIRTWSRALCLSRGPDLLDEEVVFADLLAATRRRWAADSRVHIQPCPDIRTDETGTWISAWILAGDLPPIDPTAMAAAVARLPLWPAEAYRLLRVELLSYEQIAARLAITVGEVRELIAVALHALDAALPDE